MKILKFLALTEGLVLALILSSCTPLGLQAPLLQALPSQPPLTPPPPPEALGIQYYSPLENAEYVSKAATIVVRYGPVLTAQNLAGLQFVVQGLQSGLHAGQTILADDHKTVIFKPSNPFTPGEGVTVELNGLALDSKHV